jgi:predicted alpha-1,2-mannosidase
MGDRQTFQVMPSTAGTPDPDRRARALPFRHANEVARPHYYGVTFENGLKTEIAPTDHAALFRFTFPGATSSVIFDNVNDDGGLTIDQKNGVVTGYSDVRSGLSNGATRLFVYATFDKPITASGSLDAGGRPAGYARFDAPTVNMRIATSLISIDQAKRNLALELTPSDTLESVRDRAQQLWDKKLGVVEVEGANDDQRTTLYSNLYRLSLYPNSAFENTGSASKPRYQHAVQSSTDTVASTATKTGAKIADGKVYVNNGFWDTYRTIWAAYSLFDSGTAGELVDGFVQQYRDGGWIARWSSPGYANLMTGTSSDVSFADAYVKGVQGFNGTDAYAAALKNATVAPPGDRDDSNVGRKGLWQSLFLGYTPSRVDEGISWALEGDINDYGIGNMAAALARNTSDAQLRRRYQEESEYFLSRATNYVNMFDPATGFFQGRAADGKWKSSPREYDPREWGHQRDYTETDGWGFAFHAPQDGQGLANLYGGRDGLAAKLDEFFATPETAKFVGSYGGTIHEMIEARDVRMGQWGFSNQVSHHIPYMYDYAGQPAKTQEKVREALRRLYLGSDIGQGYAGDEDNGETSGWYLFSALGFYPLQMGSDNYAIGSPLFRKATVHLGNGHDLVVRAPNNSARNVYVQGLKLDGRRYDRTYIRHEDIANGGTLDFDMGSTPSKWGADNPPPSLTRGGEAPKPLRDVSGNGTTSAPKLFDDDSSTSDTANAPVTVDFAAPQAVSFYTLTSTADNGPDPRNWTLEGSDDGRQWKALDTRKGETFSWRQQTRPFKVAQPGAYAHYRLSTSGRLGEVELLNREAVNLSPLVAEVPSVVAAGGDTVDVPVTVSNFGDAPASGTATMTAPSGWTVAPASAPFGPLAKDEDANLTFHVTLPADVAPGTYPLKVKAGDASASGMVTVVGDTIEFAANSAEEAPWLYEIDGSQFDGTGRFADGGNHYTYRFQLPADVTGGTFTLHMHAEFRVRASTDNQNWTDVLVENNRVTDGSNDRDYTLDLNTVRGTSRTFYLRFEDSFPDDGWGAWLSHLKLALQRG